MLNARCQYKRLESYLNQCPYAWVQEPKQDCNAEGECSCRSRTDPAFSKASHSCSTTAAGKALIKNCLDTSWSPTMGKGLRPEARWSFRASMCWVFAICFATSEVLLPSHEGGSHILPLPRKKLLTDSGRYLVQNPAAEPLRASRKAEPAWLAAPEGLQSMLQQSANFRAGRSRNMAGF